MEKECNEQKNTQLPVSIMIKENAIVNALPLGKPSKSFDTVGFLKRYGLYIALLGSIIFGILTPLILMFKKPYYEVHAFMKVDPVTPTLITKTDENSIVNYYQDYANTLAHSMTTVDLLTKTVDALGKEDRQVLFPRGLSSEKCAELLVRRIRVMPINRTHLLDIIISGDSPKGLAPLLNTLMRVYMEEDRKSSNLVDNDRLKYLYDQKEAIKQEMARYESGLDSLTRDISTSTYSEAFNMASKNNDELSRIFNNVMSERIKAEAHYQEAKKTTRDLKAVSLKPLVDEVVMTAPSLNATDSWTNQQLQEMRSTTDGLTPNNPDRIYVEQRMAAMKKYDQTLRNEVHKAAQGIVYGKQNIELRRSEILAKNDYEKAKRTEADLRKELDSNLKESRRISIGIRKGEYLETNLKHKHDLLDNIDTRITEIEVERKAPIRLSIESAARVPSVPMKSNFKNLAMSFMAASFGLVAGLFFFIEYTDDRIRSPRDIVNALGHPPTQIVANVRDNKARGLQCSLAPEQFRSDEIGSMAIRFCREQTQSNTRVFLFTGLEPGAGTSSIAGSCASALSKMVGKVLVIDGNIGEAKVAMTDKDDKALQGLCGYLANGGPWSEYLVSTPGSNIDILNAGSTDPDLLPRQRFRELLDEVRQSYDFICIDGAPLLHSHLTEQMAIYADVVVLIGLKDSSKFADLRRSAELLVRLGVPGIAPVLNQAMLRQRVSLGDLLKRPPAFLVDRLPDNMVVILRKIIVWLRGLDRIVNSLQGA
jgi:polysaccharide biosynthesis transport protein